VDSGLVLDLRAFHTTPLGTAETRPATEVAERYGPAREVGEILELCKDRYLLVVADGEGPGHTASIDRARASRTTPWHRWYGAALRPPTFPDSRPGAASGR
jgi:hypothetical protein